MNTTLLYLSADVVRRALPMRDAIEAMREAFAQLVRGEATMPMRLQLNAPSESGATLIMPCHSIAQKLFSMKMVMVFGDNLQRGLPTIQSVVILTDGSTGTPLAVMDGGSLTAIRTGAASGLATDLLARTEAATVAIIGAGVQARTQLEAVCCVRSLQRVQVYDCNAESAARFADEMRKKYGIAVECAMSASGAVADADIICTATTSAKPVFDDQDVRPGTHINAVGVFRPGMAEIPAATVRRARVVVDHLISAQEEAGDLLIPLRVGLIGEDHFAAELGQLVLGHRPGRTSAEEITLFKSVGVAIQDLCAGARALANARRLGLGIPLSKPFGPI
jgi:ornithine cyclodeaminase/alanine dehydrogenase-like protein (mu-crystallin family)